VDRRTLEGTAQKDNLRGLKALVIGMGVLIVLGTALVIGLVIKRLYGASGASAKPVAAMIQVPAPRGAVIGGVAAADGEVAVWVKDGAGGRIVLVDPKTNTISGTVTLSAQ
jgi:streptogramin lyase